jgi:hypothetical protein
MFFVVNWLVNCYSFDSLLDFFDEKLYAHMGCHPANEPDLVYVHVFLHV